MEPVSFMVGLLLGLLMGVWICDRQRMAGISQPQLFVTDKPLPMTAPTGTPRGGRVVVLSDAREADFAKRLKEQEVDANDQ